MKGSWMQWLGLISVPAFMCIGVMLIILSGEEGWRTVGAILAGSALIAGTQPRR